MNSHPYLRAYMAGIVLPTMFLLIAMTVFSIARLGYDVPIPIERAIAFPMAIVPNLWGVWNMLYLAMRARRWPLGVHGAVLPLLLIPAGVALARMLDIAFVTPGRAAILAPVAMIVYYLLWKHAVGYFNRVQGIAG